jgi:hypothetical protein
LVCITRWWRGLELNNVPRTAQLQRVDIFFPEHAGELCINILRRKKVLETQNKHTGLGNLYRSRNSPDAITFYLKTSMT